ncbi:MAG: 4'-phosphopantetheinyl transferase superfamily protein [Moraxellaceae bacterium]|nr:MAG: 4'-phosphopantetheinyl transferase superfamily protein [Moraxellaceae bacterium]
MPNTTPEITLKAIRNIAPNMMQNQLHMHIALRSIHPEILNGLQIDTADQHALATHPQRRIEQLISRSWRRQILATQLEQAPESLCFAKNSNGKPYLVHEPHLQLSQSHCAQQFVLAFNAQGVAVGVDIEAKQRVINQVGLAQRILTVLEMQAFRQAANPQAYLLTCWTIKEAVLKASGLGIRLNLNQLETGYQAAQQLKSDIQPRAHTASHSAIGTWAYQCFETEDYFYTVAWQANSKQQHVSSPVGFRWLNE